MSALAAVFHRDRAKVDPAAAEEMLEAQRSRGPDARRVWGAGEVAIGHGLFATTPEDDLAPSPWCSRDGAVVVALDGRIDNRDEIARWTRAPIRDVPDAAFVAAAYSAWGMGFAERLAGDFAIVLWDARSRELVLARDPMGARPLHYRERRREVRCASHPSALFAGRDQGSPSPAFEPMALFLVERYVARRDTLLEGVTAVVPGETLSIGQGAARSTMTPWPAPRAAAAVGAPRDHEEMFVAELREAVRVRMRARGPIAVHVSGGVDSSAVAALATGLARDAGARPPELVRCVFPGLACDESGHSQAVADHLGLPITSVTMPGDLAAYAPDPGVWPRACLWNPVSLMLVRMLDAARAGGARVTLTGAGSDQLLQPTGFELADALRRGDARAALRWSGIGAAPLSIAPYRRLVVQGLGRALPERARLGLRAALGRDDGLPAWMTDAARAAARARSVPMLGGERAATFARLPARRLATQLAWDADYAYSIGLADELGGAFGGELRHPFFDRRVIDLLLSFPAEVRSDGPPPKLLLRRAMRRALPAAVADRASAAEFSPFVKAVLVDAHGERLSRLFDDCHLAELGLVDGPRVRELVARARRGDDGVLREVVTLAALEVWLRQVRGEDRGGLAPGVP